MPSFGIQVYGRRKQGHPRPSDTCVLHLMAASTLPESCPAAGLPPLCSAGFCLSSPCWPVYNLTCWPASFLLFWPASALIYWATSLSLCPILPSCFYHLLGPSPSCLALLPTLMARYPSGVASPAGLLKPACRSPSLPPCGPARLP